MFTPLKLVSLALRSLAYALSGEIPSSSQSRVSSLKSHHTCNFPLSPWVCLLFPCLPGAHPSSSHSQVPVSSHSDVRSTRPGARASSSQSQVSSLKSPRSAPRSTPFQLPVSSLESQVAPIRPSERALPAPSLKSPVSSPKSAAMAASRWRWPTLASHK